MTAFLITLSVILVFVFVLLLLRFRFIVIYDDAITLRAKILFLSFSLYPEKQRSVRVSDYSYRRFMRRKNKAKKKQARLSSRLSKKKRAKTAEQKERKMGASDLVELLKTVIFLFKSTLSRFIKHLNVDIARLIVNVGANDPAQTAIIYGVVIQLTAYIIEFIDNTTNLKKHKSSQISVNADFLSGKTTYDIHFEFSLQIWQLLDIGIRLAYNYLKNKPEFSGADSSIQ